MITPEEKETIQRMLTGGAVDIRLGIHLTADDRGLVFQSFCEEMQALVPGIRVKKEPQGDGPPFFRIAENVTYQILPTGRELKPFLDFLSATETDSVCLSTLDQPDLNQVKAPAMLTVFVSPQCPHCPRTVTSLLRLAKQCPWVHVSVVDGELFPEAAKEAQVRSVPAVILDNRFRWTGSVDLNEIIGIILKRDPAMLGSDSLQQMIAEGNAEALSDMMVKSEKIYPAFIDLLTHPKWSARLGAMVVFEYLNEKSSHLAIAVLDALWDRFESAAEDVKGDILYLFGESKRPEMTARLAAVQTGSYPESLREAAGEALEAIDDV